MENIRFGNTSMVESFAESLEPFVPADDNPVDIKYASITFTSLDIATSSKKTEMAPGGIQTVLLTAATLNDANNKYFRAAPAESKTVDVLGKSHFTGSIHVGANATANTGYIELPAGAAGSPTLRFDETLAHGFFKPSTNNIGVSVTNSERFRFEYNTSATEARFHSDGDIIGFSTTISDIRFKENINPIENALFKIKQLKGVEFDWKNEYKNKGHDIGFIAQEVEKVDGLDVIVKQGFNLRTKKDDVKVVSYEKVVPILVEAIKEQQVQIDELKKKLEEI